MSGICGYVGPGRPGVLEAMLEAIDYRGDRTDVAVAPGAGLGYRWWGERPGKSPGIHRAGRDLVACAGTLAPPVASPAATLLERLRTGDLATVDGAFAAAWWDGTRLTLVRDPFGVRSLYTAAVGDTLYFASELKQLLAVPDLLERPKSGMLVPVEGWFRGPLAAAARERLLDGLAPRGLFDRAWLERLVAGKLGGLRPRHGVKIWLLVTLEAWLRRVLG